MNKFWLNRIVCCCLLSAASCFTWIACTPEPRVEPIAKALTCGCPKVVVEGVIENRSANYFSNARFFLKDASGEVEILSWLPLEVAPYHPAAVEEIRRRGGAWPPETMASYLNVPVRIQGRMEERDSGHGEKVLVVEYAERRK